MKKLFWRLKHKTDKNDMEARLEYEKKNMFRLIQGFDADKMRELLIWMLRDYDYTTKMDFYSFQSWIYQMHEAEKIEVVDKRTYEKNE